jgi:tetratricopeptide (TPR) repeat protein
MPADAQAGAAAPGEDWVAEMRALLGAGKPEEALDVADRRLAHAPTDLETRGWRGRALARLGRLREAEADFRQVLAAVPNDTDALLDLGSVLRREGRATEALEALDRAQSLDPKREDVALERGRALRALGREREARESIRQASRLAPDDPDVKEALGTIAEAPRHELRIGTDLDTFNYTDTAGGFTLGLRSDWTPRWITSLNTTYYDRFGGHAVRNEGAVTFKPLPRLGITAGGAWNHDDDVIPRSEAYFELDGGAPISGRHFVRGLEAVYNQHWYWFSQARVLALATTVILYLPRDWSWQVSGTAARSSFPGLKPDWQPSGGTRLTFPIVPRLTGNVFFNVGSEDFALTDQIGSFSAQTWGGGARWQFARRQFAAGYVFYQNRTQGRSQTSFGMSYGVRF